MTGYNCTRLTDREVAHTLSDEVVRERGVTARVLALIAEADARRLYLPAGYPSMHHYCVHELGYSGDAAFKRIQAARAARRFPALFDAVAERGLHLTGVGLLAPYLTEANADDLIGAAAGRTKAEIETLLAHRFPKTELLPLVESVSCRGDGEPAPAQVAGDRSVAASGSSLAPAQVGIDRCGTLACGGSLAPAQVGARKSFHGNGPVVSRPPARVRALAPERYALQVTISGTTHAKLRHAQALLAHKLPSGDLARVLDLALDALVEKLEKRKFANTDTPRPRRRSGAPEDPRHIPAHVKRAVWKRDGGRCTFVGDTGRRCNAMKFLEYDHVVPVARGGTASVGNLRLRCRAHNQLEAERVFGGAFMESRRPASCTTPRSAPAAGAPGHAMDAAARDHAGDVMAALRSLGVRADVARRATGDAMAASACTLEERVRVALRCLGPKPRPCAGAFASP